MITEYDPSGTTGTLRTVPPAGCGTRVEQRPRCDLARSCGPRLGRGPCLTGASRRNAAVQIPRASVGAGLALLLLSTVTASAASASAAPGTFESLFPGFLTACAALHDALVPVALALCTLSFAFAFWHGPLNGPQLVTLLSKMFLVVLLITHTHTAMNDVQAIVQDFVTQHVPARASNIPQRYQEKLAEAQGAADRENQGFFHRLLGAGIYESLIGACLTLISWTGQLVTWFVFAVVKIALMLSWTISPVLFALFCFPPPLSGLAWRHAYFMIGNLMVPLSLALAGTISDGILDGMVKDGFLKQFGVVGSVGYGLNNLMSLALLAIWLIFSSITFPIATLRLVSSGGNAATTLIRGSEVAANVGLAGLAAWSWSYLHHGSGARSSSRTPQPVPAMPPNTPAPNPRELLIDPNDPLGQQRVDDELEGLQGLA